MHSPLGELKTFASRTMHAPLFDYSFTDFAAVNQFAFRLTAVFLVSLFVYTCQLCRYFSCSGVRVSIPMPHATSIRRAILSSISRETSMTPLASSAW